MSAFPPGNGGGSIGTEGLSLAARRKPKGGHPPVAGASLSLPARPCRRAFRNLRPSAAACRFSRCPRSKLSDCSGQLADHVERCGRPYLAVRRFIGGRTSTRTKAKQYFDHSSSGLAQHPAEMPGIRQLVERKTHAAVRHISCTSGNIDGRASCRSFPAGSAPAARTCPFRPG